MLTLPEIFSLILRSGRDLNFFPVNPPPDDHQFSAEYLPQTKFMNPSTTVEITFSILKLDFNSLTIYSSNSTKSKRLTLQLSQYHLPNHGSLLIPLIKGSLFFPFMYPGSSSPTLSLLPNDLIIKIGSYLPDRSIFHFFSTNKSLYEVLTRDHRIWVPIIDHLIAVMLQEWKTTVTPQSYDLNGYHPIALQLRRYREAEECLTIPGLKFYSTSRTRLANPLLGTARVQLQASEFASGSSGELRGLVPATLTYPF